MRSNKIVTAVNVLDNADILREFIEWYLSLGVDLIVAHDFGSEDGSQDILEQFAKEGHVKWFLRTDKNVQKNGDFSAQLVHIARDQFDSHWVIQCDTDEFLRLEGESLRTLLDRAEGGDITALSIRCRNMTGSPLEPGQNAVQALTLRIDQPFTINNLTRAQQLSGELPVQWIFVEQPPKSIVAAAAFAEYGPGNHEGITTWGRHAELPHLCFLHYPMRGFDTFQTKVRHAAEWFEVNKHLEPGWGYHWRRWIRLDREGGLREDYENQFVSPPRAQELIRDGTCSIDNTVANWITHRPSAALAEI
jgi:Glycosyl transferase family 2